MFDTPQDWKSEIWWRNRTPEERLYHARIPPRVAGSLKVGAPTIKTMPNDAGLLITGTDTLYSAILAGEYLSLCLADQTNKQSGRWIAADDYIDMLKDSFDSTGGLPAMYGNPHLIKYIKGVFDVLVIDGLGEERKTDFAAHELGSLLRRRYDNMKTTIVTTRLTMSEIVDRYTDRVAVVLADFNLEAN